MEISGKIDYWLDIASYDFKTARQMQKAGRYLYTIFMCQQSIEKLLKAIYLQKFQKEAPPSHNLVYLEKLVNAGITEKQQNLLAELTTFYIEGRYPTYKIKLSSLVNKGKAAKILAWSEEVFLWLKKETGL